MACPPSRFGVRSIISLRRKRRAGEGAREIVLGGLGHLSFAFSRRVLALLIEELGRNTDGESRSGF